MGEVVITGVGAVSPIGVGRVAFWDALSAGRSGVRAISLFDASKLPVQIGGEVHDYEPKQYVKPRKSLKVMCREIQIMFGAAELAWEDAALGEGHVTPERLGVVLGADFIYGELAELAAPYQGCLVDGQFHFDRWGEHALSELYPLWMLKYLPNMAACHIGIAHDARGPNNSIVLGEVSSLSAVAEAARVIERDMADVMIAGGGGSRLQATALAYRTHDQLSRRNAEPARASRPFDAARDGMVNAEGAGALILESRAHAERRGAKILARLRATSSRFQPGMPNGALAPGKAIRAALNSALEQAGLRPDEMGYVSAHGASTLPRDQVEAQVIESLLGQTPVTAAKSFLGNAGAGAGALELAASVLALVQGEAPITLNYETPDPECPINVVHGEPLPIERPNVAVLNHNTMGQAVAVILSGE